MRTSDPITVDTRDLQEAYQEWTQKALANLSEIAERCRTTPQFTATYRQQAYEIAHNIKGMGSSFGHPLMTEAGACLCAALLHPKQPDQIAAAILAHLVAFRAVLTMQADTNVEAIRQQWITPLMNWSGIPE